MPGQPGSGQPGRYAPDRARPAGEFLVEHFMNSGDTRTHAERLNPLEGNSFGWCPGANRGFKDLPLQTYNTSDTPIAAQIPAPIVVASEPEVAPVVLAPSEPDVIMSPEATAEVLSALHELADLRKADVPKSS